MFDTYSNDSPTSTPEGSAEPSGLHRTNRDAMIETAERIGSAVGTAQRQVRRGLELVRHPQSQDQGRAADSAVEAYQSEQTAQRPPDMWREVISEQIADARLRAAKQIEQLRTQASTRAQKLRRDTINYAETHPLQTIATIAAAGFVLGFALRARKGSRRG